MKVLVFGSLNIDLIFSVDHIVKPGETTSSSAQVKSAGGKGANQAAALSKAGLEVYMAGKIGDDGKFLLSLLQSYNVNTDNVSVYDGSTGQALIQLDTNTGQNSIVLYSGGNRAITTEEAAAVLDAFSAGDMIVLQNEINVTAGLISAAAKKGLRIVLNPSPYDADISKLPLELVNLFFVNEIEGAELADMDKNSPPEKVLDVLVKHFPTAEIVLTHGKDGAYYAYKDIRDKGEIVVLPVVDTTAAGDTFTGYFIAALTRAYTIHDALMLACKASSITVSRKGAMESIPFAAEVFFS
jgi:ribokinase